MPALSLSPPLAAAPAQKVKPRLRGSLHFMAFFVAVAAGGALLAMTPQTGTARLGLGVYVVGLSLMLGVSGFYHRPTWTARVRRALKKVDHVTIFVQIAGTYTAFWALTPPGLRSTGLLTVMWGAALAGAVAFGVYTDLHRGLRAATYVALGVSTVPLAMVMPQAIGAPATAVVAVSSLLYIAGAAVYARRWPDPAPRVFGYHEVFHLMVVVAATAQFAVIAARHFEV